MEYKFNNQEFDISNYKILIDRINRHYENLIDEYTVDEKQFSSLVLSRANNGYENIFACYRKQLSNVIFEYTDLVSIRQKRNEINELIESHIDAMKKYKYDSFDSLFEHFGDKITVY